jgi:hypothetical protein
VAIPLGQGFTDYGRYARGRGSNPMQLVGAQANTSGSNFPWATLRVKISPTGKKVALAKFENTEGATKGFSDKSIPGQ